MGQLRAESHVDRSFENPAVLLRHQRNGNQCYDASRKYGYDCDPHQVSSVEVYGDLP